MYACVWVYISPVLETWCWILVARRIFARANSLAYGVHFRLQNTSQILTRIKAKELMKSCYSRTRKRESSAQQHGCTRAYTHVHTHTCVRTLNAHLYKCKWVCWLGPGERWQTQHQHRTNMRPSPPASPALHCFIAICTYSAYFYCSTVAVRHACNFMLEFHYYASPHTPPGTAEGR